MLKLLFKELRPELRESEYFFKEYIVFHSSLWPFIEVIHYFNMIPYVVYWFHLAVKRVKSTMKTAVDMAYIPLFQL